MPQLPTEIILQVVDTLVDFGSVEPVALSSLPPHHVRRKTLYSLLTVSRAVHSVAKRHLLQYCMYIDSPHRLQLLLRTLHESPDVSKYIPNLYLSPYHGEISNLQIANNIDELFTKIAPTLKRLVSNIPLRSLYPEEDHQYVRPILRRAHCRLVNLEEFTSAKDELFLSTKEDHWNNEPEENVWTLWPQLRKLALYNPDVYEKFAEDIKGLQHLDTLCLTRANGMAQFPLPQIFAQREESRNLRILIIQEQNFNFDSDINMGLGDHYENGAGDVVPMPDMKDFKGTVEVVKVPLTIYGGLESTILIIQRRVRDAAIEGTLWAGPGDWNKGNPPAKARRGR
jgi:hypothetical protein